MGSGSTVDLVHGQRHMGVADVTSGFRMMLRISTGRSRRLRPLTSSEVVIPAAVPMMTTLDTDLSEISLVHPLTMAFYYPDPRCLQPNISGLSDAAAFLRNMSFE